MRAIFISLLMFVAAVAAAGPTYRWVDAQGQVHYSDRPVEGAEEVELQSVQSYSPPAIDTSAVASSTAPTPRTAAADDADTPKAVTILSPAAEQTLWNTGGRLPVAVSVDPALPTGQKVNLYLDGNRVVDGEPGRLAFELGEIFRGEHTLTATVENAAGTEILRSDTIKFYVQQTSVQAPRTP
jgi:Domain of unknown function (DUF4124)